VSGTYHIESVARRKLAPLPEGWEPWKYERVGPDATMVTGSVPRILTRGKNKGQKRWPKPGQAVVVTDAERDAEFARYEAETGVCGKCFGRGEESAGWHYKTGTKYRTCRRCKGSGGAVGK